MKLSLGRLWLRRSSSKYVSGLPGPKKLKRPNLAKFGHKQFQKRPNPEK